MAYVVQWWDDANRLIGEASMSQVKLIQPRECRGSTFHWTCSEAYHLKQVRRPTEQQYRVWFQDRVVAWIPQAQVAAIFFTPQLTIWFTDGTQITLAAADRIDVCAFGSSLSTTPRHA